MEAALTCKNCESETSGKYCSNCGQKTATVRLDRKYLIDEMKYTFLHLNKGLTFTVKELFTRPGHTVREFLEGKRINHYKPVLLVFVLGGIAGLTMHYFDYVEQNLTIVGGSKKQVNSVKSAIQWMIDHYALFNILLIPIFAFCSWLSFKKYGYNYIENIVINCFIGAQILVYTIVLTPIKYALIINGVSPLLATLLDFPSYFLPAWLYVQLYNKQELGFVILRMLLLLFLFFVVFVILTLAISLIGYFGGFITAK
ncbi:DUF3667 domain-containing protein [Flavobacterium aurantiibacter]|uniref:DUF3667 domain-containing protein n=1 Tax=Flavobacterium aurantiibacter TaxID=2023067 RepID=A0A255ZRU0_9FLAO|nr:DUF3667 domain-containing protein [Flavobacterium aurantiibacter]OYQ44228.1 hypothetical protein CHX27_07920 [Flavobacterium aurantiibacter]